MHFLPKFRLHAPGDFCTIPETGGIGCIGSKAGMDNLHSSSDIHHGHRHNCDNSLPAASCQLFVRRRWVVFAGSTFVGGVMRSSFFAQVAIIKKALFIERVRLPVLIQNAAWWLL
jgi:hypothetical protein